MIRMIKYIFVFLLVFSASCTKKSTPETALNDFINYRFKSSQSKEDLLEMAANPLREKLESIEGEDLEKFLNTSAIHKRKLKVLLKNCEETKCFITYVLRYEQGKDDPKDFGVEVKKIAQVIKEGEAWKVSDINNVKTYVEAKGNLDVSAEGPTETNN